MLDCWSWKPEERPSFGNIVDMLLEDLSDSFRSVSFHLGAGDDQVLSPASTVQMHDEASADDVTSTSPPDFTPNNDIYGNCPIGGNVLVERGQPDGMRTEAESNDVEVSCGGSVALSSAPHYTSSGDGDALTGESEVVLLRKPSTVFVSSSNKPRGGNQHFKWFMEVTGFTRISNHRYRY